MHDFLCDASIPIFDADQGVTTLPGVLAALSAGRDLTFPGLAAHQRQPWFCFLVQLGALALTAAELTSPPTDEGTWRNLLVALAGPDADTAFALVVEDIARPALLQPPVRTEAAWARYRGPVRQPDAIDILITAKNHDVKVERLGQAAPHHWLYAFVTLQTMQGFLGRGNYGIARMNGGFSSRLFVDRVGGTGWAGRFCRDLHLLLARRGKLLDDYPDYFESTDGLGLLWLRPWDDEAAIDLAELDPYFIEVCRRIRLVSSGGRIGAMLRPSEGPRIAAAAAKGNVGDPWAPVDTRNGTAVTIPASGFDYRRVVQILTNPAGLPPSLAADKDDPDDELDLHFAVMVRGQGKTDGLHERLVPVSRSLADRFADERMGERLKFLSATMLDDVGKRTVPALRLALRSYLQGGPEKIKFDDDRADAYVDAFDRDVDGMFLDHLWRRAEAVGDGETEEQAWSGALVAAAKRRFRDGLAGLPVPTDRRERARETAEGLFYGVLRKHLPKAFPAHPQEERVDE